MIGLTVQDNRKRISHHVRVSTSVENGRIFIRIEGEADLATYDDLVQALTTLRLGHADEIHVDLADLTFCDTRSMCTLLAFADDLTSAGLTPRVHGATPQVRKLSRLLEQIGA